MDIEYSEWDALETMLAQPRCLAAVKQLMIEFHTRELNSKHSSSRQDLAMYWRVLRGIHQFGFKLWHVWNNPECNFRSRRVPAMSFCGCFNMYFINVKYLLWYGINYSNEFVLLLKVFLSVNFSNVRFVWTVKVHCLFATNTRLDIINTIWRTTATMSAWASWERHKTLFSNKCFTARIAIVVLRVQTVQAYIAYKWHWQRLRWLC